MMTTKELVAVLQAGTRANFDHPLRRGNLIQLPSPGQVIMSGDLHDHGRNFARLVNVACLDRSLQNHLVLHELIHTGEPAGSARCHSYRMVAEGAKLVARYPGQVHYLLGNHAMAQVSRDEVLKNGMPMVKALRDGAHHEFGEQADHVLQALDEFILSMPLAIRSENRIWMSHTLPSPRSLKTFDNKILDKKLTPLDMNRDHSLRALCWDRRHDTATLEALRELWQVDLFVVGHQAQDMGYARPFDRMIILASDHNHGCYLPFDMSKLYTPDEFAIAIKPLSSVA
jgi:serine/threonine-protein phosphatase PP1 catalytic subunit